MPFGILDECVNADVVVKSHHCEVVQVVDQAFGVVMRLSNRLRSHVRFEDGVDVPLSKVGCDVLGLGDPKVQTRLTDDAMLKLEGRAKDAADVVLVLWKSELGDGGVAVHAERVGKLACNVELLSAQSFARTFFSVWNDEEDDGAL